MDGSNYGHIGFRISFTGHALRRFVERIRPGMTLNDAFAYMNAYGPPIVSFRFKLRKNKEAWLLRADHDPPFTIVAAHLLSVQPCGHVTQVFRAITIVRGHQNW